MLTNVHVVKVMVLAIVMYRCESWTIKKAECPRTDAFKLWCWRRFLRVPLTARRSNQSILKEINPEYSLEGFDTEAEVPKPDHLMRRTDSLEETLILRKIEGRRRRGQQSLRWQHHWLNGHEFEETPGDNGGQRSPACCSPWGYKKPKWLSNSKIATTTFCDDYEFGNDFSSWYSTMVSNAHLTVPCKYWL